MGRWIVAAGGAESALRLAFGSCSVPRECQQLGELPAGATEAAAVFPDLSRIPEFWLPKEDLLELRRGDPSAECLLPKREDLGTVACTYNPRAFWPVSLD